MKKLLLTTAALALVLGLSQCKKPNVPAINGGNGEIQHVVLNATIDNGGSKIAEDGIGGIKWSVDDEIAVKQGETSLGILSCTNANGIFEGDITSTSGNIQFTFGTQSFTNQTGDLNAAISLSSGDVAYKEDGNYTVTMTMPHAVLKLDLSALGIASGNVVTISDESTTVASVTGVTNAANNPYYVAMPAAESKEYTFSGNGIEVVKEWTLAANTFYTKAGSSTGEAIVIAHEYEYVDLGLSVLWATCNVGADTPEEYGDYFAWGEVKAYNEAMDGYPSDWTGSTNPNYVNGTVKTDYSWTYYKWFKNYNDFLKLTKYCTESSYGYNGFVDNKTVLEPADDAAFANWGGEWRMPTSAEFAELYDNCTLVWTADYNGTGISGYTVTSNKEGYTDKSTFLPAAGYYDGSSLRYAGSLGSYWSSSLNTDYQDDAHLLYFYLDDVNPQDSYDRFAGQSVRPVRVSQK